MIGLPQRRVAGYHDIRLDGISDLVSRARGARVFDLGCNRGLVGFEFANNGAALVHGCDNYVEGIATAREVFADLRSVESRFEVVDLTEGRKALAPFGEQEYDIVLCLATVHKLRRVMPHEELAGLIQYLAKRTQYFGWRATSDKPDENETEMQTIDRIMNQIGVNRIHTSYISDLGVAAIWAKP